MTDQHAIDGMLRSWFAEDAVRTAPAHLAATVAAGHARTTPAARLARAADR